MHRNPPVNLPLNLFGEPSRHLTPKTKAHNVYDLLEEHALSGVNHVNTDGLPALGDAVNLALCQRYLDSFRRSLAHHRATSAEVRRTSVARQRINFARFRASHTT